MPDDPARELLRIADQIDNGIEADALTLDQAAGAVLEVRGTQLYSQKVASAVGEILRPTAAQFEPGAPGSTRTLVAAHVRTLQKLADLQVEHDARRAKVESNADLSVIGRTRKLAELAEQHSKVAEEIQLEGELAVDKLFAARRQQLEKEFPVQTEKPPDVQTRTLRERQVDSFLAAHGRLAPDAFRQLAIELIPRKRPFSDVALRALALKFGHDPEPIRGLSSVLAGAQRGVGVERLLDQPGRLRAAVETNFLDRLRSKIAAEFGSLRSHPHGEGPSVFLAGWKAADLSSLLAA
jgi:hypothetical protein